jgi:hypothetical protein
MDKDWNDLVDREIHWRSAAESYGREITRLREVEDALRAELAELRHDNLSLVNNLESEGILVENLAAELREARKAGGSLAVRLLQSDINLDDVERAAIDLFLHAFEAALKENP